MSKKTLTIAFDVNGNLLDTSEKCQSQIYKTEDAKDFTDQMSYVNMTEYGGRRGKSSRVYLKSIISGRKYSMFISDFNNAILANQFVNNQLSGTWHFVKKGTSQGIKLILPSDKV